MSREAPAVQARILALPVLRCERCGDDMIGGLGPLVCCRCRRVARIRQRMAAGRKRRPGRPRQVAQEWTA